MPFGRMYEWIDPFEALEDMERYIREREEEVEERLHWALAEVGRHRSVVDTALHEALQKFAPDFGVTAAMATHVMDERIMGRLSRRR